jgi:CRP-like cAMP-binding protein
MEKLILLLQSLAPMSEALVKHLRSIIQLHEFKKGDKILSEGAVCNWIYFIESGVVRSYYSLYGDEITHWFMEKGEIIVAVLSFHRRTPTVETHVALLPCRCWGITHAQLEETYRLYPEFERHGRLLTAEYYCLSEERQFMIKLKTPEDKFKELQEQYPGLADSIPNDQLATFIGIRPRTYITAKKVVRDSKSE